jgi:hypothetical protein
MKYLTTAVVFFIIFIQMVNILRARQPDSSNAEVIINSVSHTKSQTLLWWLTLGYGVSTVSDLKLQGLCALITLESGYHFFSTRVVHDQGDYFFPLQRIFDAGLLYGIGSHHTLWYRNISLGMAYTSTAKNVLDHIDSSYSHSGVPVDIYRSEPYRGIGFAYQVQLFSKFSEISPAGLGLTMLGNVNKSFTFWMLLLSLEFGNF